MLERAVRRRDRLGYDALWIADHFLGEDRLDAVAGAARERLRARIARTLAAAPERPLTPVPREAGLSARDFRRRYLFGNRPVVLAGAAADWPAMRWTPEALAARYPADPVVLISAAQEDVEKQDFRPAETTVAGLVADMQAGRRT